MNNFTLADELDQAIETRIASADSATEPADAAVGELLEIAEELHSLPDPGFRAQLRAELTQRLPRPHAARVFTRVSFPEERIRAREHREADTPRELLPSLFGGGSDHYLLNQRSFAASLAMHVVLLALVISSGVWAARHEELKPHIITHVLLPADYPLPAAGDDAHGGGGGGTEDKLPASAGSPPRLSHEQVTPPTIVVRNQNPALPVEPTVIGPPEVTFSPDRMGSPFSSALASSNGPGSGGGIGDSHGTGVGPGDGPGVGYGRSGGIGGDVYRPGGGVSAPRPTYDPEPEYSEEARRAKYQGDVGLMVIVGPDGRVRDVRLQRSLGMGLDERAMAAVRQWRFEPAKKDGHPVAVQVSIEVNFRLY
jgi:periplasmic protein TonB